MSINEACFYLQTGGIFVALGRIKLPLFVVMSYAPSHLAPKRHVESIIADAFYIIIPLSVKTSSFSLRLEPISNPANG